MEVISQARSLAPVVIMTGGLGPTRMTFCASPFRFLAPSRRRPHGIESRSTPFRTKKLHDECSESKASMDSRKLPSAPISKALHLESCINPTKPSFAVCREYPMKCERCSMTRWFLDCSCSSWTIHRSDTSFACWACLNRIRRMSCVIGAHAI